LGRPNSIAPQSSMSCIAYEMNGCNPLNVFLSGDKHNESFDIEVRPRKAEETESWRVAILTYDRKSKTNVISQELVTTVLGTPIQPFDEYTTKPKKSRRHRYDTDGYVDLEWCFENTKKTHNTRFFVTSASDPPYDAVLGRPDAEQYGILKSKNR